ncbi:3-oxoadipate enol-lactonase [Bounagaea algeriensis]
MTDMQPVFDGPVDAPVVVLGPSLGTTTGLFDAQVAALADRYRIVRFDLPGHGGAPTAPGPYTISGMAGEVLALLERHGIERFHYAGVSIGGAIGLQLALDAGDRLVSLTVCASAARFADPSAWPDRAAKVRAEGTEAMLASRPGTWYTHDFARNAPDETERLLAMLRATAAEGYAGCCEAIAAFDVRERLGEIRVPTLALAGAEDPATPPAMLQQITDAVPGSRLAVVPNTAHLLNAEAPGAVNHELAAHLADAHSEVSHG